MQTQVKVIFFSLLCLVVLSQYTNCANYEDYESSDQNSSLCFDRESCEEASSEKLQVKINRDILPQVSSLNNSFVIGGECSDGNYPGHILSYSFSSDNLAGGGRVEASSQEVNGCVNGKFLVSIDFGRYNIANNSTVQLTMSISGRDNSGRIINSTNPEQTINFVR